ncbi:hypothetical protein ACQ27_gp676 [Klebsiella phage K64-1]|nr:hypothetical protein ACQ27_gp676 [Klebsiella phage K64-1]
MHLHILILNLEILYKKNLIYYIIVIVYLK